MVTWTVFLVTHYALVIRETLIKNSLENWKLSQSASSVQPTKSSLEHSECKKCMWCEQNVRKRVHCHKHCSGLGFGFNLISQRDKVINAFRGPSPSHFLDVVKNLIFVYEVWHNVRHQFLIWAEYLFAKQTLWMMFFFIYFISLSELCKWSKSTTSRPNRWYIMNFNVYRSL